MKDYSRYIFYLFLFLFITAFFYSLNFIDPSQTPKTHYFQVVSSLLMAVFTISTFLKAKNSIVKTNLTNAGIILFLLFVCVQLLVLTPGAMLSNGFINLFLLTVLYFIVKHYFVSAGKNNMLLFRAMAVILSAGCLIGLYQYIFLAKFKMQPFIIKGSFDNPGPYAVWMVSLLPVLLSAEALPKAFGRRKVVKGLLLCLFFIILFLTKSRTAWLAAMMVVLYLLHTRFPLFKNGIALFRKKPVVSLFVTLALIITVAAGAYMVYRLKTGSVKGRLFIWENTLGIIKEKPLSGHGYGTFTVHFNNRQADYFRTHPNEPEKEKLAGNLPFAFNEYLQMAAETGIVGLALFLLVIISAFSVKPGNEEDKWIIFTAKASILAIMVCALFSYPFHNLPVMINLFFFLGVLSAYKQHVTLSLSKTDGGKVMEEYDDATLRQAQGDGESPNDKTASGCQAEPRRSLITMLKNVNKKQIPVNKHAVRIFSLFLFLLSGFLLYTTINRCKAQLKWKKLANAAQNAENHYVLKGYKKIYPILKYDPYFLYNYGAELSVRGEYEESIHILKEAEKNLNDADVYTYLGNSYEGAGMNEEAEQAFLQASYLIPHRFYPKYRLSMLYIKTGRQDEALTMAKKIVEMDVKIDSPIVGQIKGQMRELLNQHLPN